MATATTALPAPVPLASMPQISRSNVALGGKEPRSAHNGPESSKEIVIQLPILFPPFLSTDALVNPHYDAVKVDREEWASKILNLDARKIAKPNFTLISALWLPGISEEQLKFVVDFNHWIFFFDDRFDEGDLTSDFIAATREIFETLALFEENQALIPAEQDALKYMFQRIWLKVKTNSSTGTMIRLHNNPSPAQDAEDIYRS
ncbi:hypothetical protein TWF281_004562 [Arthrobotrys megalospora]